MCIATSGSNNRLCLVLDRLLLVLHALCRSWSTLACAAALESHPCLPQCTHTHTSKLVRSSLRFSPRFVEGAAAVLATALRPMLSAPSGHPGLPTCAMMSDLSLLRWL